MFNFENAEEKNEIYLGKKTITDGTKVIAHDWRSPMEIVNILIEIVK